MICQKDTFMEGSEPMKEGKNSHDRLLALVTCTVAEG